MIRAIQYGATGAMIDASTLPLEENIARTRRVVEIARAAGIGVEGELGHIGAASEEIGTAYTDVDEAVRFAEETGVCAMAVMVGTAHGHYKKAPVLAIDRIAELHERVNAHLVLHGGSGVPDDQIKAAINAGIRKVNFATDLAWAFINGCRAVDAGKYPLDVYLSYPTNDVKNFAIEKINLLGAAR
ncbi:MAG: class II fructose-bisphosphate aldolase [Oscillospiraceae bacterium]|nr:class II fructose-bisphosphate aldolase [Oscillospiraceae bacterium]